MLLSVARSGGLTPEDRQDGEFVANQENAEIRLQFLELTQRTRRAQREIELERTEKILCDL